MKVFKLFIQGDKIGRNDWEKFFSIVKEYENRLRIEAIFELNTIKIYLYCKKNLSLLTTKLPCFFLKPLEGKKLTKETRLRKKINLRLKAEKNLFEFIEEEEMKKERVLEKIIVEIFHLLFFDLYRVKIYGKEKGEEGFFSSYFTFHNPLYQLEIDFKKTEKWKKESLPFFLKINTVAPLLSPDKDQGFIEVFGFPQFTSPVYFPFKNFEFDKHTLVVGQTGVGKSKFIELFVKEMVRLGLTKEYRVVIIDPHSGLFPCFSQLSSMINIDFVKDSCNLFPSLAEPKVATELTILLFKTVLKDQFNSKMERVLKYVIFLLFLKDEMNLESLRRFLTSLEYRREVLAGLSDQYDYLIHFFETEFIDLQTKFYEVAFMPILVLIDELNFLPSFSQKERLQLETVLKDNFLTCFSLNKIFLGEKATRLLAGLVIQQIFLLAQKRSLDKKIILIIDEVSIVENEALINILSEARKFNLALFLAQQYLTQISTDLLRAILSNVYNYFVFKVSEEDSKILAQNLQIKFTDEVLIREKQKGLSEEDLKREILVTLNPRECLVRIFSFGKFYPCFKGRTMTVTR